MFLWVEKVEVELLEGKRKFHYGWIIVAVGFVIRVYPSEIGLTSLYLVKDGSMSLVLVVLGMGLGTAFFTVGNQSIEKKLYGSKDYSNVFGILQTSSSLGAIISPMIIGILFDMSNSYNSSILMSAAFTLFAVIIFVILLPRKDKEPYSF